MILDRFVVIAMDGGAACGKSSTSKLLAKDLNLLHVDTGSHYRALALSFLEKGVKAGDEVGVRDCLKEMELGSVVMGSSAVIEIGGRTFGDGELRGEEVNKVVSEYAAMGQVREFLLAYQRAQEELARREGYKGLIMEGRDIGTVVLPKADFKFYLEADVKTRVERRAQQGFTDSLEARDNRDRMREKAPLKVAEGAHVVDTSHLSLTEVVGYIENVMRLRTLQR